ncbi:HNH endonuclease signature motif containing protein [Paracoccus seriniphilus]|uniref:Putative HNH nuclease YajD n=1 Tax=Paracoccus seriniphilus TaxID=184748 RepID=A0A239Q2I7_9RHOB|nr:HNH endonuclease signature motif containing protein [Paracoccus seriniphilus]WCR13231.1 HNH endonuclease [Paracoccus seriniphilus]SNT76724.1 HNH endonuclease [Paracoccus seriniphilus]
MVMKLCCAPGCDEIAIEGHPHCEEHAALAQARLKARRDVAKTSAVALAGAAFYRTRRWRRQSRLFLDRHPLCADCAGLGVVTAAREVDHITPHRGDAKLMWDQSNWQPLCKPCHSRKTAREVLVGAGSRGGRG